MTAENMTTSNTPAGKPIIERLFVWWIIIAFSVAAFLPLGVNTSGVNLLTAVFVSACVSLLAAIGLWMALGHSVFRYLFGAAALIIVTVLLQVGQQSFHFEQLMRLMIFSSTIVVAVAFPVGIIRLVLRGDLLQVDLEPDAHEKQTMEVLQFSIRHILTLTTAIAFVAALGRFVLSYSDGGSGSSDPLFFLLALGTTLGMSSVVAVWATLGRETFYRTIASFVVAACLGFIATTFAPNGAAEFNWIYITINFVVWLQIMLLMWALRYDGYRFVVSGDRVDTTGEQIAE